MFPAKVKALMNLQRTTVRKKLMDKDSFVGREAVNIISKAFTNLFLKFIQVVPGRAGGGSFRRKKNYIAKKELAYRMCTGRPTTAMPKLTF